VIEYVKSNNNILLPKTTLAARAPSNASQTVKHCLQWGSEENTFRLFIKMFCANSKFQLILVIYKVY